MGLRSSILCTPSPKLRQSIVRSELRRMKRSFSSFSVALSAKVEKIQ